RSGNRDHVSGVERYGRDCHAPWRGYAGHRSFHEGTLMFTGLVEAVGTVTAVAEDGARSQLTISTPGWGDDLEYGESIAVNGVCLTVAKHTGNEWVADVMRVTRETTTLGAVQAGARVNLERALRADARLGGHIMQGHVDGT